MHYINDPNTWDVKGEIREVDYTASNGDQYFSIDDFWVIVTSDGVMRVEPKGAIN